MIATASNDQTVRLWDVETSTPLGPQIHHASPVVDLDFQPDGRALLTVSSDGAIHAWELPDLPLDDPTRLKVWSQVASGLGMDEDGVVRPLDARDSAQFARVLETSGGSPFSDLGRRGDLTRDLVKAVEAAESADTFASRWHLDRYLTAPLDDRLDHASILLDLGDALLVRKDTDSAEKAFREAVRQRPDDVQTNLHHGRTLWNRGEKVKARGRIPRAHPPSPRQRRNTFFRGRGILERGRPECRDRGLAKGS